MNYLDGEKHVLIPGNDIDLGLVVRQNTNGFLAVELGMAADPEVFTPELVASEQRGMPGWRFQKEYRRAFTAQAGQPVFEPEWLDVQRGRCREPAMVMDVDSSWRIIPNERGRIRVWIPPWSQPQDLPDGMDAVSLSFGIGMDVGEGVSMSESTIEVMCEATREQACEFASSKIKPSDLGRMAAAIGRWYNDALICPVRPMHGITVIRTLLDECDYPYIWRDRRSDTTTEHLDPSRMGWAKGETSSPFLMGPWMDALEYDKVSVYSATLVGQLGQYIYDESGRITHQQIATLNTQERARHGDRVVGIALAWRACCDIPQYREVFEKQVEYQSYEWRRLRYEAMRKERGKGPVRW